MTLLVSCPACKSEEEHDVLSQGRDLLVKCSACGNVHRIPLPKDPEPIQVKAIVSSGNESRICSVELLPDDLCEIGELLVAECGEDAVGVEITSIESNGKRVNECPASAAETLWTRVIETVVVKISVHDGWRTIPLYISCDGEEPFEVNAVYTVNKIKFRISHIKLREGPILRKEGWRTVAHKITRIYAYKTRYG